MELIKQTVKVGNSAGVLLPKKYLNSQVKITLEPLNIERDVLEILLEEKLLKETLGAYITGSYARSEQTIESDIDILVITGKTEKRLKKGNYDLLLVTEKTLKGQLKKNIMPLLPMIKEAKPIINNNLLNKYGDTKLTKRNLRWHIEMAKSGLNLCKAQIDLEKENSSIMASDAVAYSLILNLRSIYIVEQLIKEKFWSNKELIKIIKKVTGSILAYEGYKRIKSKKPGIKQLPMIEAEKLHRYVSKKLKEQMKKYEK